MLSAQQKATLTGTNCEVAFDNLTLQLYATDASLHQIEPAAVAFPRNAQHASALIQAAGLAGISVTARGAGTGLAGGAIGDGLVIDFSRHNREITDLNLDRRTVRVGPGVVLDDLNLFLKPHGFRFGPDVATSSRATLGGMIANNSSGSHTPCYGTTTDHIAELEVVLAEGQIVMIGPGHDTLRRQRELISDLVLFHQLTLAEEFPPGLLKRHPGYGLSGWLREPNNLNHIICGSEGTLAAITAAELKIVPLPADKGLVILFFDSVAEAMQATVEFLDLKPAAIEHIDRVLLDQTLGQKEFQAARQLLSLDEESCESVLAIEFFEDVDDRIQAVVDRNLGTRACVIRDQREANLFWGLRKAGLSLLTGCKGNAKPTTGIEDTAVRPRDLPEYVAGLQKLMGGLGLHASFYGHAGAGLLHVRPVIDIHSAEDWRKFRQLANEVSSLVKQFKGSLAAEHGVGIARTEFMHDQLGEDVLNIMREIKTSFDPHNLLNPGKVISDGRFRFDSHLRAGPAHELKLPFEPRILYVAKDESFVAHLEQCNGCGGCRKLTPTMCPTFIVTGEERMSTRGRANAIRAVLERRGITREPLAAEELEVALSNCLSCKACMTECPSNVNMSLLKADLQHARIKQNGLSMRERLFSHVDVVGRLCCRLPRLANFALDSLVLRTFLYKSLGWAWQRPIPLYARQRFDHWFRKHQPSQTPWRGRVVLWDDTFARYHEPHIAIAAVKVLEAAGFEVSLARDRQCCGRPAFSQGHLERAARLGRHNVALLSQDTENPPILFLEPSCHSMFVQDYEELGTPGAAALAERCYLFEDFMGEVLRQDPAALAFKQKSARVIIHAHCHVKAMRDPEFLRELAERLPGREVTLLDSACCGMAGAFGVLESKYELSLKVAEPLTQMVRNQPFGTVVVASGTSCRHQIGHLTPTHPRHMAEVMADALS